MSYEIKKAPKEYLQTRNKKDYPLSQMKVGDMFEAEEKEIASVYTHVKYLKRDDPKKKEWKFYVKKLPNYKLAVIRIN